MNNVRASDPITSVMAAERSTLFSVTQQSRILYELDAGPLTAKAIGAQAGMTVEQVCRRLPELEAAKLIEVVLLEDGTPRIVDACRVWKRT